MYMKGKLENKNLKSKAKLTLCPNLVFIFFDRGSQTPGVQWSSYPLLPL